jgi:hypothetical protein
MVSLDRVVTSVLAGSPRSAYPISPGFAHISVHPDHLTISDGHVVSLDRDSHRSDPHRRSCQGSPAFEAILTTPTPGMIKVVGLVSVDRVDSAPGRRCG